MQRCFVASVASVPVRAEGSIGPRFSRSGRAENGPSSFLLSPHFPRGLIFRSARTGTLATQATVLLVDNYQPMFAKSVCLYIR